MRKLITLAAVAAALLLGPMAVAAVAQEVPPADQAPAVAPAAALTLSAFFVLVLTSFLIPLAVGLLTKLNASPTVKQVLTLVLSSITGLVTTATQADGTAVISATSAQYALLALGIAIVSYLGIYKPQGANARLAPNSGLG